MVACGIADYDTEGTPPFLSRHPQLSVISQAMIWYERAANKGDARAMHNLATMYREGRGVPRDDAKAIEWYRKAAANGSAEARHNLDVMLRRTGRRP